MASTIDNIYVKASNEDISEEEIADTGIEIKQFQDEEGQSFYAKTHLDAIDGMEGYTEGLTQVAQILGDFIFDTGWISYDYNAGYGVKVNTRYSVRW